jgi:hypothetical protein
MKQFIFFFIITLYYNCNKYSGIGFCNSGNCFNGIGVYEFLGTTRKGLFRDGKFLKGEYIIRKNCIIDAEFKSRSHFQSYTNGYGKENCNERFYDGFWNNGSAHGEGKVIFKDKRKFSGIWNDGNLCFLGNCKEGFGMLIFSVGYYIGEFKEGKPTGKGLNETDHLNNYYSVYIGDHLDLRSHGFGIQIDEDGVKKGKFEDNRFVEK